MNDLIIAIHTLSSIYLAALDKGHVSFANDVKHHLDFLLNEQSKAVSRNLARLEMTYGKN
jgi:hypothetical protein